MTLSRAGQTSPALLSNMSWRNNRRQKIQGRLQLVSDIPMAKVPVSGDVVSDLKSDTIYYKDLKFAAIIPLCGLWPDI